MRIGLFTDTYPPFINGVSTSIVMLEHALRKLGHDVYVVAVNPDTMSYDIEDDHHIRLPGIPSGLYDYRLTSIYPLKAVKIVKDWDLDIIHSHTEFGVGTFARIMAKQLDIPVVHTYHTMYEDYVYYITKGHFDMASKKGVEYFTKFYCDKTVNELIVPTKKTYDLFKQKYEYDRNIHIVPTGIEVEKFYRENNDQKKAANIKKELGLSNDDFIIMTVCRLAHEKNVSFLIENQAELLKKNKHFKLLIIGDGPDADTFKKQAKDLGISDSVVFTGKVPWEEISVYYQIGDVFATASHTETQGLTVIEAMGASLPVVAANDDAFKDVVVDGLNGYLFDNEQDYIEDMLKLFKEEKLYNRMCRQARINAESHSAKYYAEKVLDVYAIALGGIPDENRPRRTFSDKMVDVIKKGFHGE